MRGLVKSIGIGLCLLVCLVAAAAMFRRPAVSGRSPDDAPFAPARNAAISMRLSGPFDPLFGGEMVAARAGLFQRAGLTVELKSADNAEDAINSVVQGVDQVGVTSAESFTEARARGLPIVAFMAGLLESPVVLYSLNQSGVHSPADFFNRRIGYQPGRDTALIYQAMMETLSLSRSAVHEIEVGTDPAPLITGDVDVWPGHVGVESYEFDRRGLQYSVIKPAEHGIHWPGTVYFALESSIKQNPDRIQDLVSAIIRGWQMIYRDYGRTVPMIVSFDPQRLSAELVRYRLDKQREYLRPLGARFGEFDEGQLRDLQAMLLRLKIIAQPLNPIGATLDFVHEAYRKQDAAKQINLIDAE